MPKKLKAIVVEPSHPPVEEKKPSKAKKVIKKTKNTKTEKKRDVVVLFSPLKEIKKEIEGFVSLRDSVILESSKNPNKNVWYLIGSAREITLTVNYTQSTFQPLERKEEVTLFVAKIIKIGDFNESKDSRLSLLRKKGCPVSTVCSITGVREFFNSL